MAGIEKKTGTNYCCIHYNLILIEPSNPKAWFIDSTVFCNHPVLACLFNSRFEPVITCRKRCGKLCKQIHCVLLLLMQFASCCKWVEIFCLYLFLTLCITNSKKSLEYSIRQATLCSSFTFNGLFKYVYTVFRISKL